MTGRWEQLTDRQQTVALLNLRSWLLLGDDPDLRAALNTLCGDELHGAGPCPRCRLDEWPADRGEQELAHLGEPFPAGPGVLAAADGLMPPPDEEEAYR